LVYFACLLSVGLLSVHVLALVLLQNKLF
jgi:hypothetical protein